MNGLTPLIAKTLNPLAARNKLAKGQNRTDMAYYITVVECERPIFEVKGGRVIEIPFEADSSALAVVRALARLAGVDLAGPTLPEAIAPALPQRRVG